MEKSQFQGKSVPVKMIVELSEESRIVLPDDMTRFMLRWIESLTANGFSNVRIRSERLNYEIQMEMEAGSILRGKIAIHQAEYIGKALSRSR